MTAISNVHRLPNRDAALKALYTDISAKNMFPFWATSADVANDEIKQLMATPRAVPFLWRCEQDIEPILNQAVELITMDDSERRSLVLSQVPKLESPNESRSLARSIMLG